MGRGNVSKLVRAREKKVERDASKKRRNAILAKMQDSIGAKGLNELQGMTWGQKIGFVISSAWIFNTWYEKMIMLLLVYMGGWKILNLTFGWF